MFGISSLLFSVLFALLTVKIAAPQREAFLRRFKLQLIGGLAGITAISYIGLSLNADVPIADIIFLQASKGSLLKLGMATWFLLAFYFFLYFKVFENTRK